jgi:hypothetical protein
MACAMWRQALGLVCIVKQGSWIMTRGPSILSSIPRRGVLRHVLPSLLGFPRSSRLCFIIEVTTVISDILSGDISQGHCLAAALPKPPHHRTCWSSSAILSFILTLFYDAVSALTVMIHAFVTVLYYWIAMLQPGRPRVRGPMKKKSKAIPETGRGGL